MESSSLGFSLGIFPGIKFPTFNLLFGFTEYKISTLSFAVITLEITLIPFLRYDVTF